jgi:hypothetical protein
VYGSLVYLYSQFFRDIFRGMMPARKPKHLAELRVYLNVYLLLVADMFNVCR